ncbi:MAG: CHAT domain-containing tetratricopeptide repeat protein [Planctomycetota bacterium]
MHGARALEEKVVEVFTRTLPEDHRDLQAARLDLAAALYALGDIAGARSLNEKVVEVFTRTLPDDHPDLQSARLNLGCTMYRLGEFLDARALFAKVLEVELRTLANEHPGLQLARLDLADALYSLGDFAGARALEEEVLEVRTRTRPEDHPDVQAARQDLLLTMAGASAAHPERLDDEERSRWRELAGAYAASLARASVLVTATSSGREAEERSSTLGIDLSLALSFAAGMEAFARDEVIERDAFLASESLRCAALSTARIARGARSDGEYEELRTRQRQASEDLAEMARAGASADEFDRKRGEIDQAQRALVRKAVELAGGHVGLELDLAALGSCVKAGQALVAYRAYGRMMVASDDPSRESSEPSLCAFVIRPAASDARSGSTTVELERIELGPLEPITSAVSAWREALGLANGRGAAAVSRAPRTELAALGSALRRLVLDPLIPELEGARHVIVELDDALHLVPLDALPVDDRGAELVGDRARVELRSSFVELLDRGTPLESHGWLGIGAVDYDAGRVDAGTVAHADERASPEGFVPLRGTREEVEGIDRIFSESFGVDTERHVRNGSDATKQELFELAPRVRFVHVATHGWFAPESVRSLADSDPIGKGSSPGRRMNSEERVRGMSPMLLCGLALAGANLPAGPAGRNPGLVTAEEIATLDLTGCELAVLSACDTNVGDRRAGQGVASLQRALHMAGARSAITSLWKVPDEATRELMIDFYRHFWVEKKPKWQALWEAKCKLREARDESGKPRYSTRDWGAWVLTGEPN